MYRKLAWRNIRRSLRDYGIYFLTLVFAVAIFYVFNSLVDQPAFLALRESTRRMAQGMLEAMQWLTMIMTGVVGLLVLYANRVIIKKRSRELGTYLLLGMEQGRLAFLLMMEITIIGMAALGVGLVSGIFLSQFFALVVNKLFAAGLTHHSFVFSPGAAVRTLISYSITFVLVGLWQATAVYRQKLIDLITAVRKNEEIRVRSRLLALAAGLLSTGALGLAYRLADQVSRNPGISPRDPKILVGGLLGLVGTYLLFAALAGLLTGVRRRAGGWLARGLNLFLYRQVTNKIATHAALLATIALMLTFTICAMSFGLGLGRGVAGRADQDAPFDYMFFSTDPDEAFQWATDLLEQHGVAGRQTVRFVTAQADLRDKELMLPEDANWFEAAGGVAQFVAEVRAKVLPLSAYRQLRALKGYPDLHLADDAFLIHASAEQTEPMRRARDAYQRFMANGGKVALAGRQLSPGAAQLFTDALGDQLTGASAVVVVPDGVAGALPANHSYLAMEVDGQTPEELDEALMRVTWEARSTKAAHMLVAISRAQIVGGAFLVEGMLVFLSFYIGVMFILISATLLALQQVTDAVEHRQRFEVLRKLGADEPMIDGAIARQLGLYFLTPVAVALLHSVVAMVSLARLFQSAAGYTTVWPATLLTLGIFALIYGTYYLLSLQSCRALFKESQPG